MWYSNEEGHEWFGQLRLIFRLRRADEFEPKNYVFIHWYEVEPVPWGDHRFTCLRWATQDSEYDVIPAAALQRLVVLQPHPEEDLDSCTIFVHNPFFLGVQ